MPGSPGTPSTPEQTSGRRLALLVAIESYADPSLRGLRAPGRDASELHDLLADPDVGGFTVTSVTDGTAQQVRLAVEEFLLDRSPGDLTLVYLSCHGLVDLRRRLYFAAADTRKERLAATGVEAQWLLDQLDDCRARRQVVILDCCFSGAFARGAKGDADLGLGERFHGQGRGRVVLTASRGTEYSFEGEPVSGGAMPGSVFTSALVAGIRSGAADADGDGDITVDDAYAYAFDEVRAAQAAQTPQRWLYGAEGGILLARSPAGVTVAPAPLPDAVRAGLDAPQPALRLGAVEVLGDWLDDADASRVLAARRALEEVAAGDVPRVAQAARTRLDRAPSTAGLTTSPPAPEASAPGSGGAGSGRAGSGRAGSDRAAPRRWMAAAGVLLAVGAVLGAVLLMRQDEPPSSPGPDSPDELVADSGWRLAVRDLGGLSEGCTVTLTNAETQEKWRREEIYNTKTFQIPQEGTFRTETNDPTCELIQLRGSGNASLPFSQECCAGDTEAFDAPAQVVVEVEDFNGNGECDFDLHDAGDGRVVHFGTAKPGEKRVVLDPGGSERVYLSDLQCGVGVSGRG
jgi:hypothetical protein